MKKVILLPVLCCISILIFSACSLGETDLIGRWSDNDQEIANKEIDKVLETIKNQDKNALKSMFAKNALNQVRDIDQEIENLFEFFEGDLVSYDDKNAVSAEDAIERNGDKQKILDSTYDVTTSKQQYRIAIRDYIVDDATPDNIGIWSFYIIKMEDDTDPKVAYRGDDEDTPGININIKNTLPEEYDY